MKIMITGFNPFNGEKVNPAQEVLKFLPDTIKGHRLIKLNVETSFEKAASQVYDALLAEMPDYCINIGQAGGRSGITPEKIAINWVDASIADNMNYQPKGQKIVAKGMDGYFTQLPINAIVKNIRNSGLPAKVSNTAGTYVCNYLFYKVQYWRHTEFPNLKGGFIHIPYLPSQVLQSNQPSMSLNDITNAMMIMLETVIDYDGLKDIISLYD